MSIAQHKVIWPLFAGFALIPGGAHAEDIPSDASIRISVGGTYSTGQYGAAQSTRVASAPLSARYSNSGFTFRVSVPFVHLEGPGTLIDTPQGRDGGGTLGEDGGSGSDDGASGTGSEVDDCDDRPSDDDHEGQTCPAVIPTTPATSNRARSGLGDVSMTVGYGFDLGSIATLDMSARVKLPTASRSKGLGTGKADVTVSGTLGHDFGQGTLYVTARRRFVGKPVALTLRDTWGLGAGASYRVGEAVTVGVDYDWQQSTTRKRHFSELTGWVGLPVAQQVRLSAYAGAGLNAWSADFVSGLNLTVRLR